MDIVTCFKVAWKIFSTYNDLTTTSLVHMHGHVFYFMYLSYVRIVSVHIINFSHLTMLQCKEKQLVTSLQTAHNNSPILLAHKLLVTVVKVGCHSDDSSLMNHSSMLLII